MTEDAPEKQRRGKRDTFFRPNKELRETKVGTAPVVAVEDLPLILRHPSAPSAAIRRFTLTLEGRRRVR